MKPLCLWYYGLYEDFKEFLPDKFAEISEKVKNRLTSVWSEDRQFYERMALTVSDRERNAAIEAFPGQSVEFGYIRKPDCFYYIGLPACRVNGEVFRIWTSWTEYFGRETIHLTKQKVEADGTIHNHGRRVFKSEQEWHDSLLEEERDIRISRAISEYYSATPSARKELRENKERELERLDALANKEIEEELREAKRLSEVQHNIRRIKCSRRSKRGQLRALGIPA